MNLIELTFDGKALRHFDQGDASLFVATDVAKILGFKNPRDALARHVHPSDVVTISIETKGGTQLVRAVNESGLYCLIFGSKLPSAQKFKRWVTSEVLPSIRRTGSYTLPRKTITVEQQQAIRSAISNRAARSRRHYQSIYRALYERFQIPRYTELLASQFDEALIFINGADLNVPPLTTPADLPNGALVLDRIDAERIRNFVYFWRYLFKPELVMILQLLRTVDSPKTARFFDAVAELHLPLLEGTLERHGYSVKEMACYKHLMNNH